MQISKNFKIGSTEKGKEKIKVARDDPNYGTGKTFLG